MAAKKSTKEAPTVTLSSDRKDKLKALKTAIGKIDKQFGEGTIMKLGQKPSMKVEVISTGILTLDHALGVGGLPRGRVIEIYGPESSGKTTVALNVIAEAQKNGGLCAFVDAEHALDPSYAEKLGVNIQDLYISQPDTGEQALEVTEALVRSGAIDVVVVDSVAALVPKAEIEGLMGDSFVGLQARLMSQALRKLTGIISTTNCMAIFINQLREKVGVMYGNPETTTGGRALKFYSSVRLDVRRSEYIKTKEAVLGAKTKVKVVKNKVAPPFKVAEFDMMFGEGISKMGMLLDQAVLFDVIHKSGAWFSYKDDKIAQGRENAVAYLKEHPDFAAEIEAIVRPMLMSTDAPQGSEKVEDVNEEADEEADESEEVEDGAEGDKEENVDQSDTEADEDDVFLNEDFISEEEDVKK